MHSLLRYLLAVSVRWFLAAAFLPCGAAEDKQPVAVGSIEGIVLVEGKPLPDGVIGFHPAQGKPSVGAVRPDGSYALKRITPATYRVTIKSESRRKRGQDRKRETSRLTPGRKWKRA